MNMKELPRDIVAPAVKVSMAVMEQSDDSVTLYAGMLCIKCSGERARIACYVVGGDSVCVEHSKIENRNEIAVQEARIVTLARQWEMGDLSGDRALAEMAKAIHLRRAAAGGT